MQGIYLISYTETELNKSDVNSTCVRSGRIICFKSGLVWRS